MSPAKLAWYAAYTKSRAEKKVARELVKLGIDHYLPLHVTIRQWSDRKRKVSLPLITSYIFVHITPKQHSAVVHTDGVVNIVHFNGKPVAIPEWQIRNLKIILGSDVPMMECAQYEKGERVKIIGGPLNGLRGTVVQIKRKRNLVISINALDYNLAIDIDSRLVEVEKSAR